MNKWSEKEDNKIKHYMDSEIKALESHIAAINHLHQSSLDELAIVRGLVAALVVRNMALDNEETPESDYDEHMSAWGIAIENLTAYYCANILPKTESEGEDGTD